MSVEPRHAVNARVIEALLFITSEPLDERTLAAASTLSEPDVEEALQLVGERHAEGASGVVLERVAGGWALRAADETAVACARLLDQLSQRPLSRAALETLAVVAYAGPVSRPEISRIRGVAADNPIKSLLERGLIEEAGRSDRPGNPILYRTTLRFDRVFGLEEGRHSLPLLEELGDDLPDAAEVRDRLQAMAATQAVTIEEPAAATAVEPAAAAAVDAVSTPDAAPDAAPDVTA
ncbi:MAG: SMC-Scp complex subunit ScpB [Actinobacteria bacterium]|nr:SMC-Scp complex subunit ScpB [Actinomycetota bacterium]